MRVCPSWFDAVLDGPVQEIFNYQVRFFVSRVSGDRLAEHAQAGVRHVKDCPLEIPRYVSGAQVGGCSWQEDWLRLSIPM